MTQSIRRPLWPVRLHATITVLVQADTAAAARKQAELILADADGKRDAKAALAGHPERIEEITPAQRRAYRIASAPAHDSSATGPISGRQTMDEQHRINRLVPWYGAQRHLAREIVRELGRHAAYWEPFCGSMAVLLTKRPALVETANDLHGDLVTLAMVLASERWMEFYQRVVRILPAEALYDACLLTILAERLNPPGRPEDVRGEHVARAAAYFVVGWLGYHRSAGLRPYLAHMPIQWAPTNGSHVNKFRSAVERIPAWHRRLARVTILRRDAMELLERIPDRQGVAVYVDPPYLRATRSRGGACTYLHDMADEAHPHLAELLSRFRLARVVVSYAWHPDLAGFYPGWTVRFLRARRNVRGNQNDVLLLNGPSYAGQHTMFPDGSLLGRTP